MVDFYPQNILTKPTKLYQVNLTSALDYLQYPEGAYLTTDTSLPGTYIQFNINATLFDSIIASIHKLLPVNLFLSDLTQIMNTFTTIAKTSSIAQEVENGVYMELPLLNTLTKSMTEITEEFSLKAHWYMLLIGEEGAVCLIILIHYLWVLGKCKLQVKNIGQSVNLSCLLHQL